MSGYPGQFPHRDLVLVIDGRPDTVVSVRPVTMAAFIQQPESEIQVLLFSGYLVQFDKGQWRLPGPKTLII